MLLRAWGLMGMVSAACTMGVFFLVLWRAGWTPGAPTTVGSPLRIACQIGTAFAARTQHSALRAVGAFSNPLLLGGIACELLFAAAVIYLPPLQVVFDTAALPLWVLGALVPMPVVVWGVDEVFDALRRRSESSGGPRAGDDLRGVGA
jgi:magnesium-transporting ATPase (P-type)